MLVSWFCTQRVVVLVSYGPSPCAWAEVANPCSKMFVAMESISDAINAAGCPLLGSDVKISGRWPPNFNCQAKSRLPP